jgi:hypothetical protein
MRGIVTHYTAYATQRTVSIYEGDRRVTYTHGDFAGTNHGVNLDLASEALEQLGYSVNSGSSWRWHADARARDIDAYKAVAFPLAALPRSAPWDSQFTPDQIREQNIRTFGHPEGRAGRRKLGMW